MKNFIIYPTTAIIILLGLSSCEKKVIPREDFNNNSSEMPPPTKMNKATMETYNIVGRVPTTTEIRNLLGKYAAFKVTEGSFNVTMPTNYIPTCFRLPVLQGGIFGTPQKYSEGVIYTNIYLGNNTGADRSSQLEISLEKVEQIFNNFSNTRSGSLKNIRVTKTGSIFTGITYYLYALSTNNVDYIQIGTFKRGILTYDSSLGSVFQASK